MSTMQLAYNSYSGVGEGTAQTDELFKTLKHLGSQRLLGKSVRTSIGAEINREVLLSASQTILARQWFRRVWVLQELVRSRDPWVQCGIYLVKWEDLKNAITKTVQAIGEERVQALDDMARVQVLDDMARLHSEYHLSTLRNLSDYDSENPSPVAGKLLALLISRRALGVQDPRDRLFAHVGLLGSLNLDESLLRLIKVDYSKDEGLVFFEIAHFLTEAFQDYRVLSLIEYGHASKSKHLSSWVPNWSVTNPPEFETIYSALDLEDSTSATYFPPNPRCLNFWIAESRVLALAGWSLARIQASSTEVYQGVDHPNSKTSFESLKKKALDNPKYHTKVKDLLSLLATGFGESYEKWKETLGGSDTPDPSKVFTAIESQLGSFEEPYDPQSFLKNSKLFDSTAEISQAEGTLRNGMQTTCDYLTDKLLPQKQVPLFGGLESVSKSATFRFESQSLLAHLTIQGFGDEGRSMFRYRKLALLEDGTPALVPESTEPGDIVAILMRHAIPLILRPIEVEDSSLDVEIRSQIGKRGYHYLKRKKIEHFTVIGECFVEGLMYGDAYKRYKAHLSRQPRVLALH
jgi:hypothetical protein